MAKRLKTIKKDHDIIAGVRPLLEDVSKIPGVKRIIPGAISRGGKIKTGQSTAFLKIQRETISGLKLLAHTEQAIQEIFLVIPKEKRDAVRDRISKENVLKKKEENKVTTGQFIWNCVCLGCMKLGHADEKQLPHKCPECGGQWISHKQAIEKYGIGEILGYQTDDGVKVRIVEDTFLLINEE